uniref:Macrophage mannose receptor 1-like n=1 Tax=Saccoglossus kowalevskii TaxID=10224 RepID=A0ABM0H1R5_SACKO|nr:PREDICTED: macrophage mannose receptor 1-like [Saccoglossus kowalevskii]
MQRVVIDDEILVFQEKVKNNIRKRVIAAALSVFTTMLVVFIPTGILVSNDSDKPNITSVTNTTDVSTTRWRERDDHSFEVTTSPIAHVTTPADPVLTSRGTPTEPAPGPSMPCEEVTCPEGWYLKCYGAVVSCYKLEVNLTTWQEANDNCETMGAHLVFITDDEEAEFLGTAMADVSTDGCDPLYSCRYFIGIRLTSTGFEYTNGESVSYFRWKQGEPNDVNEQHNCVVVTRLSEWNDVLCTQRRRYVCEFEIQV